METNLGRLNTKSALTLAHDALNQARRAADRPESDEFDAAFADAEAALATLRETLASLA